MLILPRPPLSLHHLTMSAIITFIICSLLLQSEETRILDPRQVPFVPPPPATQVQPSPIAEPLPVAVPPTPTKQARFTNGMSMPQRHNHVVLSAPERGAKLLSLSTERRDAAGNIDLDSDGNPTTVPLAQGMNVFRGQVLGKFDDRELHSILKINQTQLEVAKSERDKEIEREYAAHGVQVEYANLLAMLDGNKRHAGTFTQMEIRRGELALAQAHSYLKLQTYNIDEIASRKVTAQESEVDRTKVQIERQQLVSQIDGIIVKINAAEGEWCREGQEVLEIMRLDTLWVQVMASVKEYEISDLFGKQAVVQLALPNGRTETFQGVVSFCNPKVDGSDRFEVLVEVQNRRTGNFWLLQPGRSDVEVVIAL